MTQSDPKSVSDSGRSLVVRWRILAQKRLDHLIELHESGRWRLYHTESDFLDMVREAQAALKTWEELAPPDLAPERPVEASMERTIYPLEKGPSLLPEVSLDDVAAEHEPRKF